MKVVIRTLGIMVLALAAGRCGAGEEPKIRRFDVVPVDDKAILVDTATGDTWILEKSPTSDNKSGYIWQKIPSPFDAKFPKDEPEMQAISLKSPSPTADKGKVYEVSKVVEIQQELSSKEHKASTEKTDDGSEK